MMKLSSFKKPLSIALSAVLTLSLTSGIINFHPGTAKAESVEKTRFLQLYDQIEGPGQRVFLG